MKFPKKRSYANLYKMELFDELFKAHCGRLLGKNSEIAISQLSTRLTCTDIFVNSTADKDSQGLVSLTTPRKVPPQ